jgi:lipopolysaccharide export system protein LptA
MSTLRHSYAWLFAMAFAVLPLAHASAQTEPAAPEAVPAAQAAPTAPNAVPAAQTTPAAPQAAGAFGAFSKNSGEPIDIESDVLVVHDQQKYATFTRNVKAVQGTTTLRSNELDVHYAGGGAEGLAGAPAKAAAANPATPAAGAGAIAPAMDTGGAAPNALVPAANPAASAVPKPAGGMALGEGGNQITKIEARGSVNITTDQDQTTTSDWALFDVPAQQVTVGGNVVLTQGKNVLKGDRLVVDLKTGESRFENTGNATGGGKIRALFMPKQDAAAKDGKSGDGQTGKDAPSTKKPVADEAVDDGANAADTAVEPSFPGLPQ